MELRRASARPCDGCRSAKAAQFCEVDAAFLCLACHAGVHGANKLASSHKRAWVCEACESTPAAFACRADAAAPCRGRALANPLAGRHVGVPLKPSFDAAAVAANCDGFRP